MIEADRGKDPDDLVKAICGAAASSTLLPSLERVVLSDFSKVLDLLLKINCGSSGSGGKDSDSQDWAEMLSLSSGFVGSCRTLIRVRGRRGGCKGHQYWAIKRERWLYFCIPVLTYSPNHCVWP
jgi:hypothetical protein